MTIAGGIVLIMLGAIFTWAVEFDLAGFDINVLGVILMLGGLVWLMFALYRINAARRALATNTTVVTEDPVTHQRVYEERRYDDPPVV
ncbi:DUF6458 family protein [Planomonospora venezuelensis]|uniref:Membrane-bound ClpP family serine protease n=1 Tax=Planomonospora venezuelensis TaxID=1999 RepID=A0A841D0B4_PLAVE|nr:DUF6458 family protein [Planomonospora venezuelensis]MBB5963170.1 membrane-bound ClpP family serine protease [Planomonospora venezuelensis]GIN00046.1 hypothetical protein Pve01_17040 [Planomonospora venezuelensis]